MFIIIFKLSKLSNVFSYFQKRKYKNSNFIQNPINYKFNFFFLKVMEGLIDSILGELLVAWMMNGSLAL